ncbi:MAG: hypothetical protein AVDCRST_MAG89-3991 [uncultured Gemmatimonadetes bacterium]|uniref:Uncharacterized protein n=1 Tax=uncultured Gemmatimonadota bacterium TaxID=203437 RepID=A0A6J4MQL4_9BACT|nr:MAG: hypothetical protein AVDCRST_MAG89-3991 [uncultured Gemmatimonadota bacterium]
MDSHLDRRKAPRHLRRRGAGARAGSVAASSSTVWHESECPTYAAGPSCSVSTKAETANACWMMLRKGGPSVRPKPGRSIASTRCPEAASHGPFFIQ